MIGVVSFDYRHASLSWLWILSVNCGLLNVVVVVIGILKKIPDLSIRMIMYHDGHRDGIDFPSMLVRLSGNSHFAWFYD